MVQFAHVARPAMFLEESHRRRIMGGDVFAIALRVEPQEMRGQRWNVFAPLTQRRQMNLDCVQPEQ